jgi:acetyl-CoA C-acetyltransferase
MAAGILEQQLHLGSLIADYSGLRGVDATRVEAGCASGATAVRMAYLMVASGLIDVAVACGVERLTHADRESATQALATASDRQLESSRGETFLSLNARLMSAYLERYAVSREAFAPFSVIPHQNALGNPNAALHKEIGADDYANSRTVVGPLRVYDASPICDGAAAVVLASGHAASEWFRAGRPRVAIVGSSAATTPVALERRADLLDLSAVAQSTARLFADAGLAHTDVDLFELHDAYTIMSVLSLEAAGFAAPGTGLELGREGRIALNGDLPISTMGGLKARGHPVGASGVYQVVEACAQLCGDAGRNQVPNAELALVQNVGGTAATVVTHALRRIA